MKRLTVLSGVAVLFGTLMGAPVLAYELKGLKPGLKLEQIRPLFSSLTCTGWMTGPYEQMCNAKPPYRTLETIADLPVLGLRIFADDHGITHGYSILLGCGLTTDDLAQSFRAQFGVPTRQISTGYGLVWERDGYQLQLGPTNGKDGSCFLVTLDDKTVLQWRESKPKPKVSNDF